MYLSSRNHPSSTYSNEGYNVMHGVTEQLQGLKLADPLPECAGWRGRCRIAPA